MNEVEKTSGTPIPVRRLTVRQVAEAWQIYVGTVRRAIRAGELPATWAGDGYRLVQEDVDAWVEKKWGKPLRAD